MILIIKLRYSMKVPKHIRALIVVNKRMGGVLKWPSNSGIKLSIFSSQAITLTNCL